MEKDNFGEGIAKDSTTGKEFNIFLDDWHLDIEFQREAKFCWEAIKVCRNKQELAVVKNSNQVKSDMIEYVWHSLPKAERERIEELCQSAS